MGDKIYLDPRTPTASTTVRLERVPREKQQAPRGRHVDAWKEMEVKQGDYLVELWKKGTLEA